jgi:N-succinyldiaminopimelate aminotransferase
LSDGLAKLGFEMLPCEGTFFLTADISGLTNEPDRAFCERLVKEAGVALIPLSVFFKEGKPDNMVRFAFCKKVGVIDEALKRLGAYL